MALRITDKENTAAPDADYIYGRIKDDTGTDDGTPVNELVYNDMHQFFARLMDKAIITPNGLPDNDYSGWQLFQAFHKYITPKFVITGTTNETGVADTAILKFATEVSDVDSWYNVSNGRFIPNIAGTYEVNVKALFTIAASLSNFDIDVILYKNGSSVLVLDRSFKYPGDNNTASLNGNYMISSNGTTDYFEIRLATSTAQSWSMLGHLTWKLIARDYAE